VKTIEGRNSKGQFLKGCESWCKGQMIDRNSYPNMGHFKRHTEETKMKISLAKIGRTSQKQSETKKKLFAEGKIKVWNKGLTKESDKRIGKMGFKKGHPIFSGSEKGWFKKGTHPSPLTEFKKGQFALEKHFNWIDGRSFKPYTTEFDEELKELIRKRDNLTCRLCNVIQNGKKHDVHHIDYDKKNCSANNLVTLCRSCNDKVNFNREYWKLFFIDKINKEVTKWQSQNLVDTQ
jgi:hypothetical protein